MNDNENNDENILLRIPKYFIEQNFRLVWNLSEKIF